MKVQWLTVWYIDFIHISKKWSHSPLNLIVVSPSFFCVIILWKKQFYCYKQIIAKASANQNFTVYKTVSTELSYVFMGMHVTWPCVQYICYRRLVNA